MTDLVAQARDTRVVVVGGGIAGLAAALECARLGLQVTVLEAADRPGGAIDRVDLGGVVVDAAAEAFSTADGPLADLVRDLGLSEHLQTVVDDRTWLVGVNGAAPAPADTVLGIPANPWAVDVRRHIEWRGTWRAYLDRLRPPLTVGHRRSLGELVGSRMGDRVRDRLVAPYSLGVHGVDPELIDVDVAAPGLNAALTRTGSLGGAVASIARQPRPRVSPEGGLHRMVDALVARLGDYAAEVRTGARATGVTRLDDRWRIDVEPSSVGADAPPAQDAESALTADLLLFAADEDTTRALLAPIVPLPAGGEPRPEPLDVVLLRLRGVSVPDRGSLVIGPGARPATLRHISRTWPSVRAALRELDDDGGSDEIVRVTLPQTDHDDAEAIEAARVAASELLDIAVPTTAVVAAARRRYRRAAPASLLGHVEAVADVRAAIGALPGIAVVGGWVSGSGVATVIADATAQAAAARHAALWSGGPAADEGLDAGA